MTEEKLYRVAKTHSDYINKYHKYEMCSWEDFDYEVLTSSRVDSMGINNLASHYASDSYQFARVFGGNNKAEMAGRSL